ncbi:T9SS type A sorting domain-containing protein [Flavobacterium cellulosilyticum]|nr:T9SS type A sorting domain-containing protein [Flavobacterium cellulosilyticum]
MTVNLTLDNTKLKATMVLTGPSDRWFALQFGTFVVGDGMALGKDFVYADGTTLIDGNMVDVGVTPNTDAIQNWAITSNTITSGIRTIIAQRDLSTGDTNDYTFNYTNSTIDFAWARRGNAGYTLNNHGGGNRGYVVSVPLTTTLGIEDFSLKASSIYPNPSNGSFSVEKKSGIDKINVYSQTGSLIKTIEMSDKSNKVEVTLESLQKGIYLIELQNGTEKTWKKIIIE